MPATPSEIVDALAWRLQTAVPDLDETEILDVLWLAAKRCPARDAVPPVEPPDAGPERTGGKGESDPPPLTPPTTPTVPPQDRTNPNRPGEAGDPGAERDEAEAKLTVPEQHAPASLPAMERALPVGAPGARALINALALARALRPLRRQADSRTQFTLDEEATVHESAERRRLTPMVRPQREPWLDLALLVDGNPSMLAWQPTVRAFRLLCESLGPFRDVRTWQFDTSGREAVLRTTQGHAARDARELLGSGGRRVVLVVSDCLGPAWTTGGAARMLARWQGDPPTAILHLLPASLWRRSALGDAPLVRIRPRSAAAPNRLLVRERRQRWDRAPGGGVLLPLLTLEPEYLAAWAGVVAGRPGSSLPAVLLPTDPPKAASSPDGSGDTSPAALVKRFERSASDPAYQLALLFASVAPLHLPLLRLVQETMLPASRQVHLAEVLHGGLLQRRPTPRDQPPTERTVEYDWLPDVGDYLLDRCPINQSIEVYRRVSQYVGDRFGIDAQFEALLHDPGAEIVPVAEGARSFASIPAGLLRRLGGKYRAAADRLEKQWTPAEDPFLSQERLSEIVTAEGGALAGETLTGGLLIFKTDGQRTWLLASSHEMFVLLDDAETRASGQFLQDRLPQAEILPLRFGVEGSVGLVRFAGRSVSWYYSPELFAEPARLEEAIRALIRAPEVAAGFDWRGKSILWVDDGSQDGSAGREALRGTGASVHDLVDHPELALRLVTMDSYDAIVYRDDYSGDEPHPFSPQAVNLLREMRQLGNRVPFVILGEREIARVRKEARRWKALTYTENLNVALRTLDDHFKRPPGAYAGRKILVMDMPYGSDMRFRYDLESKGARFVFKSADALETEPTSQSLLFDVVIASDLPTPPARTPTDPDAGRTRRLPAFLRGTLLIYGEHGPEARERLFEQGARAVTNDPDVLRNLLVCSVFSGHEQRLSMIQEGRFVAWATPLHRPAAIRAVLRATKPFQMARLWANLPTARAMADAAATMLAAVFAPHHVAIYRNDPNGGSWTLFTSDLAAAPLFAGTAHSPGAVREMIDPEAGWSIPIPAGGFLWGALFFPAGGDASLTDPENAWLRDIAASLGQAVVTAEGREETRAGIPVSVFERGVRFLQEHSYSPEQANQIIAEPDSPASMALYANIPTETELFTQLMALLAAMWQPAQWDVWSLDRTKPELVVASSRARESGPATLAAAMSGKTVYEADDPQAARQERCRLAIPISPRGTLSSWVILAMAHPTAHRFQGAPDWIQNLLVHRMEALDQREFIGGLTAELSLREDLPAELQSLEKASGQGRAAVVCRAAARALPLLLLSTPPEPDAHAVAARQIWVASPQAGPVAADDSHSADDTELRSIVYRADPLVRGGPPAHSAVEASRILTTALAAQSALCKTAPNAWRFRDFLFLCHTLAAPPADAPPQRWKEAFLRMLKADLARAETGRDFQMEEFGPLWEDEEGLTPWALPPPTSLPVQPLKRLLVAGLAGSLPRPLLAACRRLGQGLARLGYGLVVGDYPGVDLEVARAFSEALPEELLKNYLTRVVEPGRSPTVQDQTVLFVPHEGVYLLALFSRVQGVILLNGWQGTEQIASDAAARFLPVFPIAQTGGVAEQYYKERTSKGPSWLTKLPGERHGLLNEEVPVSIDLLFHLLAGLPASLPANDPARTKFRPKK